MRAFSTELIPRRTALRLQSCPTPRRRHPDQEQKARQHSAQDLSSARVIILTNIPRSCDRSGAQKEKDGPNAVVGKTVTPSN